MSALSFLYKVVLHFVWPSVSGSLITLVVNRLVCILNSVSIMGVMLIICYSLTGGVQVCRWRLKSRSMFLKRNHILRDRCRSPICKTKKAPVRPSSKLLRCFSDSGNCSNFATYIFQLLYSRRVTFCPSTVRGRIKDVASCERFQRHR